MSVSARARDVNGLSRYSTGDWIDYRDIHEYSVWSGPGRSLEPWFFGRFGELSVPRSLRTSRSARSPDFSSCTRAILCAGWVKMSGLRHSRVFGEPRETSKSLERIRHDLRNE